MSWQRVLWLGVQVAQDFRDTILYVLESLVRKSFSLVKSFKNGELLLLFFFLFNFLKHFLLRQAELLLFVKEIDQIIDLKVAVVEINGLSLQL